MSDSGLDSRASAPNKPQRNYPFTILKINWKSAIWPKYGNPFLKFESIQTGSDATPRLRRGCQALLKNLTCPWQHHPLSRICRAIWPLSIDIGTSMVIIFQLWTSIFLPNHLEYIIVDFQRTGSNPADNDRFRNNTITNDFNCVKSIIKYFVYS